MAGHGKLRRIIGSSKPDPFRVGDLLGELLQDAQETLYIATTGDVWADHDKQAMMRRQHCKERWILSGNRWGKSDWGARECRYWLLGDHPFLSQYVSLPTHGWATSDILDNARDITIPKLIQHIPYDAVRHYPTVQQKWFELTNGSKLFIKSCEQGRGAFQGTGDDFHWWDDIEGKNPDLAWECYKEGRMRIQANKPLWTWGTMTPVEGQTPLIEFLLKGLEEGTVYIYQGSIHDNPHLTEEDKAQALSGITEEWERKARESGQITLLGGNYLFNIDIAERMIAQGEPSLCYMYAVRTDDGMARLVQGEAPSAVSHMSWKIWQRPVAGHRYVLYIDPAGGELSEKAEWTVLKVFDIGEMAEVACLRSILSPKPTAKQGMLMASIYNHALLGIEANTIGIGVIDHSRAYPRLYRRHQLTDVKPKAGQKIGWYMSEPLKEKAISDLVDLVNSSDITLRELETWKEMKYFIRFPNKRIGHRSGHTDDGIMAAAGAVQLMLSPQLDAFFSKMQLYTPGLMEGEDEPRAENESQEIDSASVDGDQILDISGQRCSDPTILLLHQRDLAGLGISEGTLHGLRASARGGKVWGE